MGWSIQTFQINNADQKRAFSAKPELVSERDWSENKNNGDFNFRRKQKTIACRIAER